MPISFKGIPGDHVCIVDFSLEEGAYFVEGSSGVKLCTVDNEQKDCVSVKDTGVEGVKGMSFFDSSK